MFWYNFKGKHDYAFYTLYRIDKYLEGVWVRDQIAEGSFAS